MEHWRECYREGKSTMVVILHLFFALNIMRPQADIRITVDRIFQTRTTVAQSTTHIFAGFCTLRRIILENFVDKFDQEIFVFTQYKNLLRCP
jgi:hypothetical protein